MASGLPQRLGMALCACVVLSSPAVAEVPDDILWDPDNAPAYVHSTGDMDRDWTFTCTDPSDQFPLSMTCRTYDIMLGDPLTGGEVTLLETDCGTFNSNPATSSHLFTIPDAALETDRRYAYAVICQDGLGSSKNSWRWFWYDDSEPTVSMVSGPTEPVANDEVASFEFTCADTSFDYDMSGVAYTPACRLFCTVKNNLTDATVKSLKKCDTDEVTDAGTVGTMAYTDLAAGEYRFEVFGRDGVNLQSVEATWVFEVYIPDETAPETVISNDPPTLTNATDIVFEFECNEAVCTYTCTLTDANGNVLFAGACNSGDSFAVGGDGDYTFVVLATDEAGNSDVDPSASTHSFEVDTTPPTTSVDSGCPEGVSGDPQPEFEFACQDENTPCTFECTLTNTTTGEVVSQGPCESGDPFDMTGGGGDYTFTVVATDAAGNTDAAGTAPGDCAWTFDPTPPDTEILTGPPEFWNSLDAEFTFTCNVEPCTFDCELSAGDDGAGEVLTSGPCVSGDTFSVLGDGTYTFVVLATNAAGVQDPDPSAETVSIWTWTVDTVAPSRPEWINPTEGLELASCTPVLQGTADPNTSVQIFVDGVLLTTVESDDEGNFSYPMEEGECLEDGAHDFTAVAVDAAGNESDDNTVTASIFHDTDGDGIADSIEIGGENPTDPNKADTDGDGLCDGPNALEECLPGEDVNANGKVDEGETDPNDWDTDDGGVSDGEEFDNQTNPLNPDDDFCEKPDDCDGDGLTTSEEDDFGSSDTDKDTDDDGLLDNEEFNEQTDPNDPDTDDDGISDYDEVKGQNATNPNNPDTDGDGLCDGSPVTTPEGCEGEEDSNNDATVDPGETDPTDKDTDDGGVEDGVEVERGTDPLDPEDDIPLMLTGNGPIDCASGGGQVPAWPLALLFVLGLAVLRRR